MLLIKIYIKLTQTELVGRQPRDWATFETSHEKHDLHQLCRSEHSRRRRRLWSPADVLGILGISLDLPWIVRGSVGILVFLCIPNETTRWVGMEQCSWYLRRWQADILGRTKLSREWWRREASRKTSRMDWKGSTTGDGEEGKHMHHSPHYSGTTVSDFGTPCTGMLRGLSRLPIHPTRWVCSYWEIQQRLISNPQDIEADERLVGFHASLANPGEGNIPGFPKTPGNRLHQHKVSSN